MENKKRHLMHRLPITDNRLSFTDHIMTSVHKVTAFITRERPQGRELLVFHHPNAGIQLPAGTVEPGEDLETAVLREVAEETGLTQVRIVRYLGIMDNELAANERVLTRPVQIRIAPDNTSFPFKKLFTRGVTVQFEGQQGGFTKVSYLEYDQLPNPTSIAFQIIGWVPNDAISSKKPRHFFHLNCEEETAVSWSLPADNNHIFHPFWTPLTPKPALVSPQHTWLDTCYTQIFKRSL
ncbi:MAG: NUDIX domain-containing protein [Anaerolineales bacterium]|nr:NUDIX domain-containing protein [Anaerolineales bacterium]